MLLPVESRRTSALIKSIENDHVHIPVKTNIPRLQKKPDMKALNGKDPATSMYRNCKAAQGCHHRTMGVHWVQMSRNQVGSVSASHHTEHWLPLLNAQPTSIDLSTSSNIGCPPSSCMVPYQSVQMKWMHYEHLKIYWVLCHSKRLGVCSMHRYHKNSFKMTTSDLWDTQHFSNWVISGTSALHKQYNFHMLLLRSSTIPHLYGSGS